MIVNEDAFTDGNLRKAGYEENPLEDGTLDGYQVFRVPMTSMTTRATEGIEGMKPAEAQRSKNVFALGLSPGCTAGRSRRRSPGWRRSSPRSPAIRDGQPRRLQGRLQLRRDGGAAATPIEVKPAPLDARRLPQRRRHPGDGARADRRQRQERPAAVLRQLPDHARPPSCCTSSRATTASASARSRPRTRSPPPTWRSAPPSPATSGSPRRAAPAWT